jgi:hypothetical protein
MPRCPGILDEETLFLQSIVSTDGGEHPLGVGDRDLIAGNGRCDLTDAELSALNAARGRLRQFLEDRTGGIVKLRLHRRAPHRRLNRPLP